MPTLLPALDLEIPVPTHTFVSTVEIHSIVRPSGLPTLMGSSRLVMPILLNREESERALGNSFPDRLMGAVGTTNLHIFIDETGSVRETRIAQTSGFAQLDEVARIVVMEVARFRPAFEDGQPVGVWVEFPASFEQIAER